MKKLVLFCIFFCFLYPQNKLPNYKIKILNNETKNLYDLTNDVTLISFWATWCLPCIKEIDKINLFVKEYENLSVILINTDKAGEITKVKRLINSKKYPLDEKYHIVMDLNKKLSRSFNAQPIPLTLIVKNDNIIFRKRGFNIGDEIEIRTKIEQALFE